jgi:hypothetical protein
MALSIKTFGISIECQCAECHFTECSIFCYDAERHYAECRYAECHYAESCYAECHYAESRGTGMSDWLSIDTYIFI